MKPIEFNMTGNLHAHALPELLAAGETALYEEALAIMAVSQEEYVPIDTGFLKSTGHVSPPEQAKGEVSVRLGFWAEYAAAVHERVGGAFRNGSAKYLETPMALAAKGMAARVALRMKKLIDG